MLTKIREMQSASQYIFEFVLADLLFSELNCLLISIIFQSPLQDRESKGDNTLCFCYVFYKMESILLKVGYYLLYLLWEFMLVWSWKCI